MVDSSSKARSGSKPGVGNTDFGKAGFNKARQWAAALLLQLSAIGSVAGAGLAIAPLAQAQNFGQRTIAGKVVDDTETIVGGATVFLKNMKTKSVKSYTSQPDGVFRFTQVGMADDYEVWAERNKTKSGVRTISSFDSRKEVQFELKLK